jgi:hypothetical protein
MKNHILHVKNTLQSEREESTRTSIFAALMNPNATEGHIVPTVDQMVDEAFIVLGAAADTTGNAMTVGTYHVLSNPAIYHRVREEIRSVYPDANAEMDWVVLARLPYLVYHLSYTSLTVECLADSLDWGYQGGASPFLWRPRKITAYRTARRRRLQRLSYTWWCTSPIPDLRIRANKYLVCRFYVFVEYAPQPDHFPFAPHL